MKEQRHISHKGTKDTKEIKKASKSFVPFVPLWEPTYLLRQLLYLLVLNTCLQSSAQNYQPNWESLDKRPTPQWFKDSKFGIFIHWGVYAVPGWSPKGTYAEWYQQGLQGNDTARQRFHKAKFGDRTYYDLANDFKAELYKPDEWARLFEKSGAKYIVLTSKHHDGFTLWPSKEANKTWGFPWNAVDIGPKRDLLGELFAAVRKTSVKPGMYYSLYEWFNPLWKSDKSKFAEQHVWPQMKDLINTYRPFVFWTDGDWDAPAETWNSQEFLTWMFNESPVKDNIVVNDRWGAGLRFKHGGFFTPEYQPDLDFEDHDWEESRGMGYSYGYNREEDAWDYNSTQSLIIALIDKVSRGGNFLLDIGPDEHGKIPPIMQDRLLEMGEWLALNGESIYNTRRWKTPVQWSEGRRDYKLSHAHNTTEAWKTGGDIMLKLTVDPDPGYAVKEIFYTYNEKTNTLYAIFPKFPDNRKLVIKDNVLPAGTRISFLSTKEDLVWTQEGNKVVISLPEYNPNKIKLSYAYAIKIQGYGKFAAKPNIDVQFKPGALQPTVDIKPVAGTEVRYTIDGTEPDQNSLLYTKPFIATQSMPLKAKAFQQGALSSSAAMADVKTYQWNNAVKIKKPRPGLNYSVYELRPSSVADLEGKTAVKTGTANKIDISNITRQEQVGLRYEGYVSIPADDVYKFHLISDDGSRLWIDDSMVIDHDGLHGNTEKEGSVALKKGYHKVRVDFFQATGGIDLSLKMSSSKSAKQLVPAGSWFH